MKTIRSCSLLALTATLVVAKVLPSSRELQVDTSTSQQGLDNLDDQKFVDQVVGLLNDSEDLAQDAMDLSAEAENVGNQAEDLGDKAQDVKDGALDGAQDIADGAQDIADGANDAIDAIGDKLDEIDLPRVPGILDSAVTIKSIALSAVLVVAAANFF